MKKTKNNEMENKLKKVSKQRPLADRTLDPQMVTIDLLAYIEQIKKEKTWRKSDRNSIIVFKATGLSMILMTLRKRAEIREHTSGDLANIQVLEGKLLIKANEQSIRLSKGQMLAIHEGIPHSLQAKKKSIFLLTLTTTMTANKTNFNDATAEEQHSLKEESAEELSY